jgi:hypothetical protein
MDHFSHKSKYNQIFLDLFNTLDFFNFDSFNVEGNINDMDVEAFILFQAASIIVAKSKEFFTTTEMVKGVS